MGLFNFGKAKVCPICGGEYKGMLGGEKTRDGEVCAECWSKFKSVSNALISDYTVMQVKDIIEGADILKNSSCSICGRKTDMNAMPIADSIICHDCERLLRGMYFIDASGDDELAGIGTDIAKEDVDLSKMHMKKALDNCAPSASAVAYIDDCFTDGKKTVLLVGAAKGIFEVGADINLVHAGQTITAKIIECYDADSRTYEELKKDVSSPVTGGGFGWIVLKDVEPVYDLDDYIYS